jgi:hypothetical protein
VASQRNGRFIGKLAGVLEGHNTVSAAPQWTLRPVAEARREPR